MMFLTPDLLKSCYQVGVFPMATTRDSFEYHLVCPRQRALLSIDKLHIPRRFRDNLKKNKDGFHITINQAFDDVIDGCAEVSPKREDTWINPPIRDLFCALHREGYAHSIEVWQDDKLAGGLYGLAMGAAFFGESMFSRVSGASKTALVYTAARLWAGGFEIFDVQFKNRHLEQFGVFEVAHKTYLGDLQGALAKQADFQQTEAADSEHERLLSYLKHLKS